MLPNGWWRVEGNEAMIRRFNGWMQRRRYFRALTNIRIALADFGYPVDDITSEEILSGMRRAGLAVSQLGVAAEEAATAFRRLARSL
jgi:hypothetical protein